jgi:transcriptional regulator with XRE-family HTH domain
MRQLRLDYGLSQRTVAEQIGLSRDQLNRIERGLVSPRFAPCWTFCEFTGANPLWLAFGEPYGRLGFAAGDMSDVPAGKPFNEAMRDMEGDYIQYRSRLLKVPGPPRIRFSMVLDPPSKKSVAPRLFKHYLSSDMASRTHTWENLRSRLHAATKSPGAKGALAHHFNVSAAAVSQWLSGASAPTADTTLRLLEWVTAEEAQSKQKKRAGSAETRPALETRKSKSTSHEKAKSDRKKK